MTVSVEISYYPLLDEFIEPVNIFIENLSGGEIKIEVGKMSTIITGEYNFVMTRITESMGEMMKKYPSVFNLKLSNSCSL